VPEIQKRIAAESVIQLMAQREITKDKGQMTI